MDSYVTKKKKKNKKTQSQTLFELLATNDELLLPHYQEEICNIMIFLFTVC